MSENRREPLNGTKTHPLTVHARGVLKGLCHGAEPRQNINAGVCDRLEREDLVETVMLPSPFATHKGKLIRFLQITPAGVAALAQKD